MHNLNALKIELISLFCANSETKIFVLQFDQWVFLRQLEGSLLAAISHYYHPTGGLLLILHFDWLRYQRTISSSHRVAKFVGFSFVSFPNKFQLAFANFIIFYDNCLFCPTSWSMAQPFRARV